MGEQMPGEHGEQRARPCRAKRKPPTLLAAMFQAPAPGAVCFHKNYSFGDVLKMFLPVLHLS